MSTDRSTPVPIVCTLQPDDYRERLLWIVDLNRDALRSRHRDGRRLQLTYDRVALDRVQEMIARERECCSFLAFHVEPATADSVRVVIEAPEEARDALDAFSEPFLGRQPDPTDEPVDVEAP